jgi:hypothetical protein
MGNRNAKHGRYTAEAVARRREVAAVIRTMRALTPLEERLHVLRRDQTNIVPKRSELAADVMSLWPHHRGFLFHHCNQ